MIELIVRWPRSSSTRLVIPIHDPSSFEHSLLRGTFAKSQGATLPRRPWLTTSTMRQIHISATHAPSGIHHSQLRIRRLEKRSESISEHWGHRAPEDVFFFLIKFSSESLSSGMSIHANFKYHWCENEKAKHRNLDEEADNNNVATHFGIASGNHETGSFTLDQKWENVAGNKDFREPIDANERVWFGV